MNWNLNELFASEEEFEQSIKIVAQNAQNFEQNFKGNLANLNSAKFNEALREYEAINAEISKIMSYVHLDFARDTTKGAKQAKTELICNNS